MEIKINKQLIAALGEADANIAIDQLDVLMDKLLKARDMVEKIKLDNAEKKAAGEIDGKISYQWNNNAPTHKQSEIGKNLRRGSYRQVRRFVEVDPVYIVCVGQAEDSFDNRYRIVDSVETVKGVLLLHNLI